MSATLIQTQQAAESGGAIHITLAPVQVGDLIVLGTESFFTNVPPEPVCTDDIGNTYEGGFSTNGPGFGQMTCFYCKVTVAGSPQITVTFAHPQDRTMIAASYRNAGDFDQVSYSIGFRTTSDPGTYPNGTGTGKINLADTLICTFTRDTADGNPLHHTTTDSGESTQRRISDALCFFDRQAVGPGNTQVLINGLESGGNTPTITMTFSKPLARPAGLITQFAVRGGLGFDNREPTPTSTNPEGPVGTAINRPLTVTLPYQPVLGSLVIVGVAQAVNSTNTVHVEDDYGNVYHQLVTTTNGNFNIVIFYTVLTALPASGRPFRANLVVPSIAAFGGVYQSTGIVITERVIMGIPTPFATAVWDHSVFTAPVTDQIYSKTINNVPQGTYLLAVGFFGPTGNQYQVDWSALEGYTLQASDGFIQFNPQGTNFFRSGTLMMMDKFAPSLANYDAQMLVTGTNAVIGEDRGVIALIALSISTSGWKVQEA